MGIVNRRGGGGGQISGGFDHLAPDGFIYLKGNYDEPVEGDWRQGNTGTELVTQRYEGGVWRTAAADGNSVTSDAFHVYSGLGNISKEAPEDPAPTTYHNLIKGYNSKSGTVMGTPLGPVSIVGEKDSGVSFFAPMLDPAWVTVNSGATANSPPITDHTLYDIPIEKAQVIFKYRIGLTVAGIGMRITMHDSVSDDVIYTSCSDHSWNLQGDEVDYSVAYPAMSEISGVDELMISPDTANVNIYFQFSQPAILVGAGSWGTTWLMKEDQFQADLMEHGITHYPTWEAKTYAIDDMVVVDGVLYVCTVDGPQSMGFLSNTTSWSQTRPSGLRRWESKFYFVGDQVVFGGQLLTCIDDGTQVGGLVANSAAWTALSAGVQPHEDDVDYLEGGQVFMNGQIYAANNDIDGVTASVPFVVGYGWDEWTRLGSALSYNVMEHDANALYTVGTQVLKNRQLYVANTDVDGTTTPVPFVVGSAGNQWTKVVGTIPVHDEDAVYNNGDLVFMNGMLFMANYNIDGSTTPVPFVVGTGQGEWSACKPWKKEIRVDGIGVSIAHPDSGRSMYMIGDGNVTIVGDNCIGGDAFTIYNRRTSKAAADILINGFTSVYIGGALVAMPAVITVGYGSRVTMETSRDSGATVMELHVTYPSGADGWIFTSSYSANDEVIRSMDGYAYMANSSIAANTTFIVGTGPGEWRISGTSVADNILDHDPDALYSGGSQVMEDGRLHVANNAMDGTTTPIPFVSGTGDDQWTAMAHGIQPHDALSTYVLGDWCTYRGHVYVVDRDITVAETWAASAGSGKWNKVGGDHRKHNAATSYFSQAIVFYGVTMYRANTAIAGTTGVPIPFVEGYGNNQWTQVGAMSQKSVLVSTSDVALNSVKAGRNVLIIGSGNITLNVADIEGGERFEIINSRSTYATITLTGFASTYVRGPKSVAPVANTVLRVYPGETVTLFPNYNGGNMYLDAAYSSGHKGWVLGDTYEENESVMYDGEWYRSNSPIAAAVAFLVGTDINTWRPGNNAHSDQNVGLIDNDAATKTFKLGVAADNSLYIEEVTFGGIHAEIHVLNDTGTKNFKLSVDGADLLYLLEIAL